MASVNKVLVDIEVLKDLYVGQLLSIPLVSSRLQVSQSTVRARLKESGLLRSRSDAIRLARDQGRIGSGLRGKTRVMTDEWKRNISLSARRRGEARAKGASLKPSGYLEHTRGDHKGRPVHVTTMEEAIGRRVLHGEVVHHVDHDRTNNDLANLQLMTRSEHSRLHALENTSQRKRAANGKFE